MVFYSDIIAYSYFVMFALLLKPEKEILNWVQLFKTNDVVNYRDV